MADTEKLKRVANQLRIESIRSTTIAGSGHPTSCASAADLVAALFFDQMRFDPTHPRDPRNDRFVLSKGHAAPLLYAAWAETGHFDPKELDRLRTLGSDLEGHPTPRLDFVDVATGSLGQGLSAGVGMAINAKMDRLSANIYVLMGDGELAEGSVWEAANLAGIRKLGNLTAILDVNRMGQSQATAFGRDVEVYRRRFEAFGWEAVSIDGHDMRAIIEAYARAGRGDRPLCIVAATLKGKGIVNVEDKPDWHGKPIPKDMLDEVLAALKPHAESAKAAGLKVKMPTGPQPATPRPEALSTGLKYKPGDLVATRKAFGNALERIGSAFPSIVVLDGDVENSTYTIEFGKRFPERFVECYIAEQNMVGVSTGLSALGKIPFASTFAAFFTRAGDQIRMAAISQSNIKLVGTHAGVSIGEDGPSQMGLEDVSMMRAVHGSVVLCPCDAVSTERLVEKMAETRGITYLRTARPETPVIYSSDDRFEIGGARVLRESDKDRVTVVAAGVTVFEALKAQELLAKQQIPVTVIDAYSIKPLATDVIGKAVARTQGLCLTVEDHYPEGGLGDAVAGELSESGARVHILAVRELPHSGKKDELMSKYRIDAPAIVDAVRTMLDSAQKLKRSG